MVRAKLVKHKAWKFWRTYLRNYWPWYAVGVLTVFLTNAMQVLGTRTVGWIIDFFMQRELPAILTFKDREETFVGLFALLLIGRILLTVGRIGWRLTLARRTHFAGNELKAGIWRHVHQFRKKDLETKFSKGVVMNIANSDVNQARFLFGFTLVAVVDVVFLGIMSIGTMLTINPLLTAASLFFLLFLPFAVKRLADIEITNYRLAQDYLSKFNDLASQAVETIRLQRLTQTGVFWVRRLVKAADEYRKKRLKAVKTSLKFIPVMGSASIISYVVLFALGIQQVLADKMSIGDFMAMQGLIFLIQDPLLELGFIISEWKKGMASLGRVMDVYYNPKDQSIYGAKEIFTPVKRVYEANDLAYQFYDGDRPVFDGLHLDVWAGERLGITGPVGSGKSTLLQVFAGIKRDYRGKLRLFEKDLKQLGHGMIRQEMAFVPQRPFLFAQTIRRNIAMERELDESEIWKYLALAGVEEDVRNFPYGLDTPLGEWGINLSGGQKQRLTLARALARRPRILLLDDCLSAVDTVTEGRIIDGLNRDLKTTTVIWVAHRASTLKHCDEVITIGNDD